MSVLVVAEHNNQEIKASTFNTINAASQIDPHIEVLVMGSDCQNLANDLSQCKDVKKVLLLDKAIYKNSIAELFSPVVLSCNAPLPTAVFCAPVVFAPNA